MTVIAATELKNKLGQVIEQARREPIYVKSGGQNTVVIVDHEEFARLLRIEDVYWAAKADKATKSGFLSPEDTVARLTERMTEAGE
jgi:prevent-host-death family protein